MRYLSFWQDSNSERGGNALITLFLTMVCLVLSGCATPSSEPSGGEDPSTHRSEPRLPSAEAGIRGTITEVHGVPQKTNGGGDTAGRVGAVLIEEDPGEGAGSQKDNVTVTEATELFEQRGQVLTRAGFGDLEVGREARAWYTGPVAESYPRQATANVIVVYPSFQ